LRLTASLRIGVVLFGGRKTADFLGDRASVRVVYGSGTATQKCGPQTGRRTPKPLCGAKFFHR